VAGQSEWDDDDSLVRAWKSGRRPQEAVVFSLVGVEASVVGHGWRVQGKEDRGTARSVRAIGLHAAGDPWRGLGCVSVAREGSAMMSLGWLHWPLEGALVHVYGGRR
jgi:hypothetical protein